MVALFDRIVAAADPQRMAIDSPDGSLTYGELLDRARALATELGRRPRPILLYGHKQPAMLVGILAALCRERPYLPVDPSAPANRIVHMLDAASPTDAVLIETPPLELLDELHRRDLAIRVLDPGADELVSPTRPAAQSADVERADPAEAPAYILFTSGTTGVPKGVPIPYRALTSFTNWLLESQRFLPRGETFLNQAPFSFDLSVMDLYGSLLSGGTLFCITRDEIGDPRRLFARLDGSPISVWVSTPSFARFCLAEPRFRQTMLPALRRFLFCGETLPAAVARELIRRFPNAEVWNTYGPTETTVAITGLRIDEAQAAADAALPVGWPFPNVEVLICDPVNPHRSLPNGETGEIVIAGQQVAHDYLFASPPVEGPVGPFFDLTDGRRAYRTGDLGRIDPTTGLLYWDGRIDRQIKLHGYRIELEEIEAQLRAVAGIVDAAVLVVERGGHPEHLVAFVVPEFGSDLPTDELGLTALVRTALAQHLPAYSLPRIVRPIPQPPLTTNGKLDRRALSEQL
jgi:D-alanine--poly(phosphoribitol) ligase subunit 1